jgi:hypothetical protein
MIAEYGVSLIPMWVCWLRGLVQWSGSPYHDCAS